jgi:hypothetical protein
MEPDPLAAVIEQARDRGWSLIPQVGAAWVDHALMRRDGSYLDVVTLPPMGDAMVVRLSDGVDPAHPRVAGAEWWRHPVPLDVALGWALSGVHDDARLVAWRRQHEMGGQP